MANDLPKDQTKGGNGFSLLSPRPFSGAALWDNVLLLLSIPLCMYVTLAAYFGPPEAFAYRSMFTTFLLILCFATRPVKKGSRDGGFNLYVAIDLVCMLLPAIIQVYMLWDYEAFQMRFASPTLLDKAAAIITVLLVLEATRRCIGLTLVMVAVVFIVLVRFAESLPGVLHGPSVSNDTLITTLFMGFDGIYGIPIQVMSTFIMMFIIFGGFLEATRAGEFFIRLALALAGRSPGGPAKVAVISSGMVGTISGSAVANVMITGTFTIPLMKRLGYRPVFAGAVEAVASTGGMLMPPIMGAAAFIIAQCLGVPYLEVCKAAVIPALLYYYTAYLAVHIRARQRGLQGLPPEEVPAAMPLLKAQGFLFLPLILIVAVMVRGQSAVRASMLGIVALLVLSFIRKETRLSPFDFVKAFQDLVRSAVVVGIACACAGIITGCIFAGGLASRFTSMMLSVSGGNKAMVLGLCAVSSLILGMGLPVTAVYITTSLLAVPVLTRMGVAPMAAHLFNFIFATISGITPPVAQAAFAAASISGASAAATGWQAFFLGLPIYAIPFSFVFNQELLMMGSAASIGLSLISCVAACTFITIGTIGFFIRDLSLLERGLLIVGGLTMFAHGVWVLVGGGLALVVLLLRWLRSRASKGLPDGLGVAE